MREKIVVGNWKMNMTYLKGIGLLKELLELLPYSAANDIQVIIAPPFIHLPKFKKIISKHIGMENISLAAQNCSDKESGAYTGEISATMVKSAGADFVMVGHSERRQYFSENNQQLSEKVKLVLRNKLSPIYCCGEKLSDRENNTHFEVVRTQIEEGLFHFNQTNFSKTIIAYEPVWAIGTGVTASAAQAQEMHRFIRNLIQNKYGNETAENCSILYGGSCNAANAEELFANPDVDGGLIGGASLKAKDFVSIINSF